MDVVSLIVLVVLLLDLELNFKVENGVSCKAGVKRQLIISKVHLGSDNFYFDAQLIFTFLINYKINEYFVINLLLFTYYRYIIIP